MFDKSASLAVLEYLETVTKLFVLIDVIYLDFAEASDKVPHARLLKTLEH